MNPPLINFIPFLIQIKGIPCQSLSRKIVGEIGRAIGDVMEVDYNVEPVARVEFVFVQINWDVENPLRYERLRDFCEVCGMLTHDSVACLIQNGGGDPDSADDDDADMPGPRAPKRGVDDP